MKKNFSNILSGSLGDNYLFSIDVEDNRGKDIIEFRLKLSPKKFYNYIDTTVDSIYSLVFKLKVNDTLIFFKSVEVDLKYFTYPIAFLIPYKFNKSKIMNISTALYVCSIRDSNYIGSSFINEKIYIPEKEEEKYFISLDRDILDNFVISTLTDFDFYEYKLNDNGWKKVNSKTFTLSETLKTKNYIQVRGKKENVYFYSNVIKF